MGEDIADDGSGDIDGETDDDEFREQDLDDLEEDGEALGDEENEEQGLRDDDSDEVDGEYDGDVADDEEEGMTVKERDSAKYDDAEREEESEGVRFGEIEQIEAEELRVEEEGDAVDEYIRDRLKDGISNFGDHRRDEEGEGEELRADTLRDDDDEGESEDIDMLIDRLTAYCSLNEDHPICSCLDGVESVDIDRERQSGCPLIFVGDFNVKMASLPIAANLMIK